jgi:hypothetical protein
MEAVSDGRKTFVVRPTALGHPSGCGGAARAAAPATVAELKRLPKLYRFHYRHPMQATLDPGNETLGPALPTRSRAHSGQGLGTDIARPTFRCPAARPARKPPEQYLVNARCVAFQCISRGEGDLQ